jgi:hypothetical protein
VITAAVTAVTVTTTDGAAVTAVTTSPRHHATTATTHLTSRSLQQQLFISIGAVAVAEVASDARALLRTHTLTFAEAQPERS